MKWTRWSCALALVALASCMGRSADLNESVFRPPGLTMTDGPTGLKVGEDCGGGGACTSGPCVHYLPDAKAGFVCSRRCASDAVCPASWKCVSVYPGPANEFCVPPRTWAARVVEKRR
jgi:hypothetical protein